MCGAAPVSSDRMNEPESTEYGNQFIVNDRLEAGRLIAQKLRGRSLRDAFVLAIPRGGVVLGYEIAETIGAELDIVTPRKLVDPYEPELAIGAVMPDGTAFINEAVIAARKIQDKYVSEERARCMKEAIRRLREYRGGMPHPEIRGRLVLLVDDGIATGATIIAAARWVRNEGAARVVIAVPFVPSETARLVRNECDELVCIGMPESFMAVSQFYREFPEVTDKEVIGLLGAYRSAHGSRPKHGLTAPYVTPSPIQPR